MKEKFLKYFKGDTTIWIVVFLLSIVSMLTVYSATGTLAYKKMGGNTMFYLIRHGSFLLFGIGIIFAVHRINFRILLRFAKPLVYLSAGLLIFTLLRGVNLNAASRWVSIMGVQFQTSDLAKIAVVMFIASILSQNQDHIDDPKAAFWPIVKWAGIICLLIFGADFSTAAMLFFICCVMMYIGGIKLVLLAKLLGCILAGLTFMLLLAYAVPQISNIGRVATIKARIESFVGIGEHNDAEHDFQADHSKMAIVHGGIIGQGPGNSTQRNFLPHPYSDFIYAIIVEETGIIGGSIVLALYIILLFRVRVIVKGCRSAFGTFLCIGLVTSLVIQALVNMGVAVNIFPVTGQTLPLVSMGGTSVVFTSIAIGVILNVSRYADGGDLAEPAVIGNQNTNDNSTENQ
ncbi:MAG: FtsW/RodA/SpoVE family cell cycle protein [Salinivirgaceae bacterium]|nr:FtsW/RodA/SpoVE family cell cycle protein [Salinivirgaceae bacterium]